MKSELSSRPATRIGMPNFGTIKKLNYFVVLAEDLHFGRAAARLGISQPPLSQQIQALERELNVQLFDRSMRRVKLTRAGQALYAEAKRVLQDVERLGNLAKRTKELSAGVVRIACFTSAMFSPMPELIDRVRRKSPNIDIMIREAGTAEGHDLVEREEVDIAIVRSPHSKAGLCSRQLIDDYLCIAVPDSHPLARRKRLSLSNIADQDIILFPRNLNPEYFDSILSPCVRAGFSPRVTNHGATIISQLGFVACGLGVAIVPSSFQRLGFKGIQFIPLRERIPNHVSVVFRDDDNGHAMASLMNL